MGIAGIGNLKKAGRVGLKAIVYFEIVTTLALAIGLTVANVAKPGAAIDRSKVKVTADAQKNLKRYTEEGEKKKDFVQLLLHIIPDNVVAAFAGEDVLPFLCFAVLFGLAVAGMGETGAENRFRNGAPDCSDVPACCHHHESRAAGGLGGMAYTIGTFGRALIVLLKMMGCVYLTMAVFIFVILALVCWLFGFSLWRYLVFIRDEIVLVLGTSSSEKAPPAHDGKVELLGCGRDVVRMVIPAGYSFNLDGTSIYLSMAMLFIAMFDTPMSFGEQLSVIAILMLTSKGGRGDRRRIYHPQRDDFRGAPI